MDKPRKPRPPSLDYGDYRMETPSNSPWWHAPLGIGAAFAVLMGVLYLADATGTRNTVGTVIITLGAVFFVGLFAGWWNRDQ